MDTAATSSAVVVASERTGGATATDKRPPAPKAFVRQQVPDRILRDEALNAAIAALPPNYNFEIHKTVWRAEQAGVRNVALQFPEGLLMYACVIADVLERFVPSVEQVFILGDVTFGACCVDDFSAAALGADLLVHYGHSCLVPVSVTSVPCMYVFVDIAIDVDHLVGSVELGFEAGARLALAGTIQFASAVQLARQRLSARHPSLSVPKCRPLSPGEVLGCTAPVLPAGSADAIVFVADGRFHLEAIMIANPGVPAYRYDPYARVLTRERYDHGSMRRVRRCMVERARSAARWGLVLGTLGRQGNPALLARVEAALCAAGGAPAAAVGLSARGGSAKGSATRAATEGGDGGSGGSVCGANAPVTLLMSEVSPARLAGVANVDAFVQVACPRLSIDWGEGFQRPTLTPFEALVALGAVPPWWEEGDEDGSGGDNDKAAPEGEVTLRGRYPMDYYAKEGGAWKSSWH